MGVGGRDIKAKSFSRVKTPKVHFLVVHVEALALSCSLSDITLTPTASLVSAVPTWNAGKWQPPPAECSSSSHAQLTALHLSAA
jgi:hypothetical protein